MGGGISPPHGRRIKHHCTEMNEEKLDSLTALAKYFDDLKRGDITEAEWSEHCLEVLDDILQENEDVLLRLKHS